MYELLLATKCLGVIVSLFAALKAENKGWRMSAILQV